jgi:hypothetical protein
MLVKRFGVELRCDFGKNILEKVMQHICCASLDYIFLKDFLLATVAAMLCRRDEYGRQERIHVFSMENERLREGEYEGKYHFPHTFLV